MEYAPAEVDTFIAFADAVEEEFEGIMVDGIEVCAGWLAGQMSGWMACRGCWISGWGC